MKSVKILKDDHLLKLTTLSNILSFHRIVKKISFFYYVFMLQIFVVDVLVIIFTNQYHLILTRYIAFGGASFLSLSNYIILYHRSYAKMYSSIYYETFPNLWPLRHVSDIDYKRFQSLAKRTITVSLIMAIATAIAATAALPWYGNEYNVYFPVKVAVDYLKNWKLHIYLFLFYSLLYHGGFTVISNLYCFMYMVLHLYNQFCMINEKLKMLSEFQNAEDNVVTQELISCIKLHQQLLEFTRRINSMLYFPIFYYAIGVVIIALSLFLYPIVTLGDLCRMIFTGVIAIFSTGGICFLGQLLENESEKTFMSACATKWYLWNRKNKKLLQIFLSMTQKKTVISSSGIITINYRLLIGLYRTIYPLMMFLIHISNTF
ncbi:hypothetical protein Zmor_005043 [Zophobas morio]|uniref:Odorant receptor n=1 Tax=Zophobas morio TaxID=2755281 RepID=A0AA38INF4_9CUCU|nr:hypothetical protein Zmor_005043 [Zophobas morio]